LKISSVSFCQTTRCLVLEEKMPTYQYECENCNHSLEIFQSMLDDKITKCPECGKKKLTRLIGTGSGIIFKGNGFYETDYKNKNASVSNISRKEEKATSETCQKCPAASNCSKNDEA